MPYRALAHVHHRRASSPAHCAAGCLTLAAMLFAACGRDAPGNALSGSIDEANYDLSFQRVDISSDGKAVSIRYGNSDGTFPCKLTVTSGEGVDLASGKQVTVSYGRPENVITVERQLRPGAKDGTFPEIASGSVIFDRVSVTKGQQVRGSFALFFYGKEADEIRDGLTVGGKFDGTIGG